MSETIKRKPAIYKKLIYVTIVTIKTRKWSVCLYINLEWCEAIEAGSPTNRKGPQALGRSPENDC